MREKAGLDATNKQSAMKVACTSFLSALLLLLLSVSSSAFGMAALLLSVGVPQEAAASTAAGPETDFNGDGYEDLAIGVPDESINGKASAGSVNVVYGSASGISATAVPDQRFFQDLAGIDGVSKPNDRMGTDVAAGDFNGDGYSDLAAGVPGDDYGSPGSGAVNVVYGSASGLSVSLTRPDQIWSQASPGIADDLIGTCPIETFGQELAAGDFNGDGYDDLAISAPETFLTYTSGNPEDGPGCGGSLYGDQGMIFVIYGSPAGLAITMSRPDQFYHESSFADFGFAMEAGDFNGDGKDDLAVSWALFTLVAPGDLTDGGFGGVFIFHGAPGGFPASGTGLINYSSIVRISQGGTIASQDSGQAQDHFGYAMAAGDFNGDNYDDLAIDVPGEDMAPSVEDSNAVYDDEGAVNVVYGSAAGLSSTFVPDQFFTQDSPGVEGTAEIGDRFGSALAVGDFNGDGKDDLAVGVPDEDVGTTVDAGSSNIIYGSAAGLSPTAVLPDRVLDQNSANVEGTSEATDAYSAPGTGSGGFAAALTAGDYNNDGRDDLAVGVPGEDVGTVADAGSSNIIYGSASSGTSPTAVLPDRVLDQNSADVEDSSEAGDRFGYALA